MQGIFDALSTVGTVAVGATMVQGLFAGASLQAIWSLFNTQQLSIHYLILNVTNIPSNAFAFQEFISEINMRAQYKDFLEDFYPMMFNFTKYETPIE